MGTTTHTLTAADLAPVRALAEYAVIDHAQDLTRRLYESSTTFDDYIRAYQDLATAVDLRFTLTHDSGVPLDGPHELSDEHVDFLRRLCEDVIADVAGALRDYERYEDAFSPEVTQAFRNRRDDARRVLALVGEGGDA